MSKTRPGTHPSEAPHPERAAVFVPRRLGLLHAADVEAVCASETLGEALIMAVRFLHQARAVAIIEPHEPEDAPVTRVYYRVGDTASTIAGTDGQPAEPDQMISIAFYANQTRQWANYQMASSVGVCTQLRLALLGSCLSTATLGRDPIDTTITRPYPIMFPNIQWSDICAALILWWWHHTAQGWSTATARMMLSLRMNHTLAAQTTFPENGNPPVLAPPPNHA